MTKTPRFWRENKNRYNLIGVKCGSCNAVYFPSRIICPDCGRKSMGKMDKFKFSGRGTVYSNTVVHEAHEQYEMQKPYAIALIELEEGARVLGQIVDCEPYEVQIGMKVKSTFRKLGQDGKSGTIYYGYKFVRERE
ncbi:MAG TPA: Zn-ribbon domain-containing OB-fold protein [Euryarchaeota archaeon]|nr:Zn-ribbon domain-containing OB-fold protein [Euryarchaeota archaeon]